MSWWSNFFNRFKPESKALAKAETISGNMQVFTAWNGGAYSSDIYRGAVDAIARNVAKLKGAHVISTDASTAEGDRVLNRLLQTRPNAYMNAYDMLYKLVTHYYLFNNAFAFLDKDERRNVRAIYPITCTQADFLTDPSGALYVQFRFKSGDEVILPYRDIVQRSALSGFGVGAHRKRRHH